MMGKYSKSPAITNPTYPQFVVSPFPRQYCTNVQKVHHNIRTSSSWLEASFTLKQGEHCAQFVCRQESLLLVDQSSSISASDILKSRGRSFTWESSWLVGHKGAEEIGTHNNQSSTSSFNGARKGIGPRNNQPFTHPLLYCPIALIARGVVILWHNVYCVVWLLDGVQILPDMLQLQISVQEELNLKINLEYSFPFNPK